MATFAQIEKKAAHEAKVKEIRIFNRKEMENLKALLSIHELPQEIGSLVEAQEERICSIKVLPFKEFQKMFPDTPADETQTIGKLGEVDKKTSFPNLYIYNPEVSTIYLEAYTKGKKMRNARNIEVFFKKKYRGKYDSKPLYDFVVEELPEELPENPVIFDGVRERVKALLTKPGAVLYGNSENEVFAVGHVFHDNPSITIFYAQIDAVAEFAQLLCKRLNIADGLATQISAKLANESTYFSISEDVHTDFMSYAMKMARLSGAQLGSEVMDLLQGNVEVVEGAHSGRLGLNIESELPSAFVFNGRLYVYDPNYETEKKSDSEKNNSES